MSHPPRHLSDRDLLTALAEANHSSLQATVDFLEHLAEVDRRRLYLPEACASMFTYCVERLHLAEGAAHRRIRAARAGRRFPVVFDMLRRGELHLTAVALLQPLLTPENHLQVLERARHRTAAAVKVLVAELAPRPDGPDVVRRLPASRLAAAGVLAGAVLSEQAAGVLAAAILHEQVGTATAPSPAGFLAATPTRIPDTLAPGGAVNVAAALASPPLRVASLGPAPRIEPTAPDRFRISFTADQELTGLLDEVRDLLGHQVPRSDLATVFKRSLVTLREELLRQRTGRSKRQGAAVHGAALGSGAAAPRASEPAGQSVLAVASRGVAGGAPSAAHPDAASRAADRPVDGVSGAASDAASGAASAAVSGAASATTSDAASGAASDAASGAASDAASGAAFGAASGAAEQPAGAAGAGPADGAPSRHVPNGIRRQVWARDEGRCTFVNGSGDRCSETSALELDHLRPWALHHEHTLEGITLRCRRHNEWTAEMTYGAEHMEQARRARPGRRGGPAPGGPGGSA